jgi:hypothetical protein
MNYSRKHLKGTINSMFSQQLPDGCKCKINVIQHEVANENKRAKFKFLICKEYKNPKGFPFPYSIDFDAESI